MLKKFLSYIVITLTHFIVIQVANADVTDLKQAKTVDSDCLIDFGLIFSQNLKNIRKPITADEKLFIVKATNKAAKIFNQSDMGPARKVKATYFTFLDEKRAALVLVCNDKDRSQGNCMKFFFQRVHGYEPKLGVVTEDWHIGEGSTYLVCE